jgi:hypothetical protein
MSFAARLTPGIALAAAGVVALAPAVLAPPTLGVAQPTLPVVHLHDIQLAGIGQDIYYAITPTVQYAVGGVSYLINFIPLLGGPTAAQININYFQGIQPVVEATVNYLAAVVQDPFNFFAATGVYGDQLYGIGYNWVDAELRFFGLPPLPPLPPAAASVTAPARAAAAQRVRDEPAAVAPEVVPQAALVTEAAPAVNPVAAQAPSEIAEVDTPAVTRPRDRARATRSAAVREQPRAAAAAEPTAVADEPDVTPKRTSVRAARAGR